MATEYNGPVEYDGPVIPESLADRIGSKLPIGLAQTPQSQRVAGVSRNSVV